MNQENAADITLAGEHSPAAVARELVGKLAPRSRHVCALLGAGASCAAGLPTLAELQEKVSQKLTGAPQQHYKRLIKDRNIELVLSRLRRMHGLLADDELLDGISGAEATELDALICSAIMQSIEEPMVQLTPFKRFASWAGRMEGHAPLEVFTVNYDLLVETGLEAKKVPYFDGFIGGVEARFFPELVEPHDAPENRMPPEGFVRLWKLHGSTNWRSREIDGVTEMVRATESHAAQPAAIYPSDEKYEQSRRVPFVVLMDRLRRALVEPETITLCSGYSFGDAHLNEMLFDASSRHPRSEVVAFFFGEIPEVVRQHAESTRNFVALAPESAIIGGREAPWSLGQGDLPGVFEGGRFLLGDFARLATFLSRQVVQTDD